MLKPFALIVWVLLLAVTGVLQSDLIDALWASPPTQSTTKEQPR